MTLYQFIRDSEAALQALKLDRPPLDFVCQCRVARDRPDGLWLEFGTGSGTTTKIMSNSRRHGLVYTFDWFQGLPEDWFPEYGVNRGHFAQPAPGDLPPNVEIVFGRFEDALAPFLEAHKDAPVDLVHIDCDLYSSTSCVLEELTPRIIPGTVMVFDEIFFCPGYIQHEAKALYEWLEKTGKGYDWIGTHGEQSGLDVFLSAEGDPALKERNFIGPNKDVIGCHVPLKDRAALIIR